MELYDFLLLERNYEEIIFEMSNIQTNWDLIIPNKQLKDSCINQYNTKLLDLKSSYKHLYN